MSMGTGIYTGQVCVVIHAASISEDELRTRLGSALPLKFTSWEDRAYLTAIRNLRPRVIVVAASDDRARDSAALLGALLDSDSPTIATLAVPLEHFTIQQLGESTQAQIRSLDDLILQ